MLVNLTQTEVTNIKTLLVIQQNKELEMGHALTHNTLAETIAKLDLSAKKEYDRVAKTTAYLNQENKEPMNVLSIDIEYSEMLDGYCYSIWDTTSENYKEANDSLDGGLCTGRLIDALEMATQQAENVINKKND